MMLERKGPGWGGVGSVFWTRQAFMGPTAQLQALLLPRRIDTLFLVE